MPKYLWRASYTPQGLKGLMKDGGTKRRAAVEGVVKKAGGKLESFYFAFGEADVIAVVDLPDHATAAAVSFAVNSAATVELHTSVLLSPEEIDGATKKSIDYHPPGS